MAGKKSEKEEKEISTCPRCGWTGQPMAKPADDEIKEFLRSVWGGRPFVKRFPLYDGKVSMTFSSLPDTVIQRMNGMIREIVSDDKIPADRRHELCLKIKLSFYLKEITVAGLPAVFPKEPGYNPVALTTSQAIEQFSEMQEPVIQGAVQSLLTFLDLQQRLVMHGFDDSFWKGAGLG